ncbi:sensor histidine kinase [Winogradskyella flava]|uniref:Histidine kinase n=1 Tax=Winogradskyella flava TaxID=1884876 RepID=A0A842IQ09_9FLAO|nr:histidine kinase [Winogradskyella flava]MBC2845090.1 histidine kinase [Winogradskyella flava]
MNNIKFNKTDYQLLGIYFLVYWVWNSLDIFFETNQFSFTETFILIPVKIIQMTILLWFIKWVIETFLITYKSYIGLFSIGILGLFSIGFFFFLLINYYIPYGHIKWERLPSIGRTIFFNVEDSIINVSMPLVLFFGKKYYDYRKDQFMRINEQKELELKVLRAQFDPHFLYNNLNTIDALVDYSSKETIKAYISNLAALYRNLIQTKDEELVDLKKELDLIKNYFFLIETRFEGDYSFKIIEKASLDNKYVPNGALLTSIENIVKHNIADANNAITTSIYIEKEVIKIINTKNGATRREESFGTGLNNLKKRYQLLADKTIAIEDRDKEFILTLPILHVID